LISCSRRIYPIRGDDVRELRTEQVFWVVYQNLWNINRFAQVSRKELDIMDFRVRDWGWNKTPEMEAIRPHPVPVS